VPYEAVIISHENFIFLAIVSFFESILKLITALSLLYLEGDSLLYYASFTMLTAIIIRVIKRFYSKRKYEECNVILRKEYDLPQIKELLSFAGWNLFGTLCGVLRSQGIAVLINLFFVTAVNAAYGIANQLNAQLMFFSKTMLSAIRPQIMKSEGANNRERTIRLSLVANKFAFYLFTFFALPFFLEMPYILRLWLDDVPEYTVEFCRYVIILTFILQLNSGLMAAVQAIGKIKYYQIIAGSIQLLVLPMGYVFLSMKYEPYYIVLGAIFLEFLATIFRIYYFKILTGYSVKKYIVQVILTPLSSLVPVAVLLYLIRDYFPSNLCGFVTLFIVSSITYVLIIYSLGLTKDDKRVFNGLLKKIKNKKLKK
jgi:O-antigen/teichoic acid export membrane protein